MIEESFEHRKSILDIVSELTVFLKAKGSIHCRTYTYIINRTIKDEFRSSSIKSI